MIELALAAAISLADPQCVQDGERLRGELRFVETQHPNGTALRYAFLVLVEARCVDEPGVGQSEGKWVQLSPAEGTSFDTLPPGTTIVVEAEDYFTPHTAWHVGDIVALGARLVGYELQ